MVGNFTAAAIPAQTSSPIFPLSTHVTVFLVKTCASLYLPLSLQSHLDFVVDGIWVLRIFASVCVIAFGGRWGQTDPSVGENCQSSHGKSWLQTVLPDPGVQSCFWLKRKNK